MQYDRFFNDHPGVPRGRGDIPSDRTGHEHHHHHHHRPADDYDPYQIPPDWEFARTHAVYRFTLIRNPEK